VYSYLWVPYFRSQIIANRSTTLLKIYGLLSVKEKLVWLVATGLRVFGSILEIAGLAMIGVIVSLLSNTDISDQSVTGYFVSEILGALDGNPVIVASLISLGFFVSKSALMLLVNHWVAMRFAELEVGQTIKSFSKLQDSKLEAIENFTFRQISHGLNGSASVAFNTSINSLSSLIGEVILLLSVITYMFIVDWSSTLALIVFFAFILLALQFFLGRKLKSLARESDDASVGTNALVLDLLENFRQARSPHIREGFSSAFLKTRSQLAKSRALSSTLSQSPRYAAEIALAGGVAMLVTLQIQLNGQLDPAGVSILIVGAVRLIGSLVSLQGLANTLLQFQEQSKWALKLSYSLQDPYEGQLLSDGASIAPSVIGTGVTYAYPDGTKVLDELNFKVGSNELLLIRGKSGAGKSTLADLILGLRSLSSGSITIDGFSPLEFNLKFPGKVIYVPQKTSLIEGTVLENILLSPGGPKNFDNHRLENALKKSGLSHLVDNLTNGLQTVIGAGHHGLSGGQIQRIGLARALYLEPKLMVLDEITSSLDAQTTKKITETINDLKADATIILISHRPEADLAFDGELQIL
jgi:ABC-type multidrug transport system fused ATPase/permease subunit